MHMKSLNAIQKKLFFLCSLLLFFSCKPSTSLDIDKPHDPNKPILVESPVKDKNPKIERAGIVYKVI